MKSQISNLKSPFTLLSVYPFSHSAPSTWSQFVKLSICLLFVIPLTSNCTAQDLHFSQFDVMIMTLNPASTGVTDADYRLANNYKIQWASVANTPYKTYEISYDMPVLKSKLKNTYLGAGGYFYQDVAGKSRLTSTSYNFCAAAHQKVSEKSYLSAGLLAGLGKRKINTAGLSWDSQFNGIFYDPGIPSGETIQTEKVKFKDYAVGGMWFFLPSENLKVKSGFSYYHLNQPKKSFYAKPEKMYPKVVFNSIFSIKLAQDNKLDRFLMPQFIYMRQGPHHEIYAGTLVKYLIQEPSKYTDYRTQAAVSFGGFYRWSDAMILATRIEYGPITLGISYDVNVSRLRNASSFDGGVEFSFVYSNLFNSSKIKMDERMILPQL